MRALFLRGHSFFLDWNTRRGTLSSATFKGARGSNFIYTRNFVFIRNVYDIYVLGKHLGVKLYPVAL